MTIIGLWLAIAGYGLAYAGAVKMGGGQCGVIDAFKGTCRPLTAGAKTASTAAPQQGVTLLASAQAQQQQQANLIGTQPMSQVA